MKALEQIEALKRNCSEIISENALLSKIEKSNSEKKPLTIKAGFDPSTSDLHLGHTVLLTKLRQFQDLGHRVVFIIGDTTARIGDPSGRSQTRPALSQNEVMKNAATYQKQANFILDKKKTTVRYNSEWFNRFKFEEILNLISRVTVSQILERDDFQKRMSASQPLSMMEMFYPLMQAYDSVEIKADVEIGGNDQKFNLLLGRQLQREFNQEPQVVITLPLLIGLDGKQKMSKSLNNHIALTDPAREMYGKLMSVSDERMKDYYDLLTDIEGEKVTQDIQKGELHPKKAKENMARIITSRFWGENHTADAEREFEKIFSQRKYPSDSPLFELMAGELKVYKLVQDCHCAVSASEASRLVSQKAVFVNGQCITDPETMVSVDSEEKTLKVGKRRFARFRARS